MMLLQLKPPIPLETPKGKGLAHLVIDPGMEHDLQWVVFITKTRECWTFRNAQVKISENITLGRLAMPGSMLDMHTPKPKRRPPEPDRLGALLDDLFGTPGDRLCTCDPAEAPVPCEKKYALSECQEAAKEREQEPPESDEPPKDEP